MEDDHLYCGHDKHDPDCWCRPDEDEVCELCQCDRVICPCCR